MPTCTTPFNQLNPSQIEDNTNQSILPDLINFPGQLIAYELALMPIYSFISKNECAELLIFSRADFYLHNNQPKLARENLLQLKAGDPNPVPIIDYYIALSFYLENNFTACLAYLNTILIFSDRLPEIRILLARVLYQQTYFLDVNVDAKDSIVSFLTLYQENTEALGSASMNLLHTNDLSLDEISDQMAFKKGNSQYDALLAQAPFDLFELKLEKARIHIARILKTQPTNGKALSFYDELLMLWHKIVDAKQQFYISAKYMDSHAGTWHLMGWCEFVSNNIKQAKSAFETALEIDNNTAENHGALAVIAIEERNFKLANQLIKAAEKLNCKSLSAGYAQSLLIALNDEVKKSR